MEKNENKQLLTLTDLILKNTILCHNLYSGWFSQIYRLLFWLWIRSFIFQSTIFSLLDLENKNIMPGTPIF